MSNTKTKPKTARKAKPKKPQPTLTLEPDQAPTPSTQIEPAMPSEPAQVVQVDQTQTANVLEIISRAATDPNCDVDKMERLMSMQERMLDRDAESAFNIAMTAAQSGMRAIVNDKKNDQTSSKYATLAAMDKAIRPIYTEAGFALSFGTGDCPVDDFMRIICDVSHVGGHTKNYKIDMPLDAAGIKGSVNKTKTHAHGSTMSYGQRYLTKLIFNLSTSDQNDDDGNAAGAVTVLDWQIVNISTLLKDKNLSEPQFMKYLKSTYKIDRIADLPSAKFDEVISRINAKPNGTKK